MKDFYETEDSNKFKNVHSFKHSRFHEAGDSKHYNRRGNWRGRGRGRIDWNCKNQSNTSPKKSPEKFIYGNFHRYYGYRNQDSPDMRLSCMKREWLTGKDVLDIGCNAGHFTLAVAKYFSPRTIIGVDIDGHLVRAAMKNAKHYLGDEAADDSGFPQGLVALYGPVAQAVLARKAEEEVKFPYNVSFVQANYVLESDELLLMQEAHFDTVLCLSLTKWVQLNWGDDGIKQMFRRIFTHLRPGGFLILEAQAYSSYGRKKKLTETIHNNYLSMKFFPEQYNEFLVKEVGFKTCELIDTPAHCSKGFSRPLYLFTKGSDPEEVEGAERMHIFFKEDESSGTSELSEAEELSD